MELLTIRQAFDAMFCYLDHYYQLDHSEVIGDLLSSLNVDNVFKSGYTADPAEWTIWMQCVCRILWPDSPEKQTQLEALVADKGNLLGWDMFGGEWYAQLLPDGRQLWANVYHGTIMYGGIHQTPKQFELPYGLSSPANP